MRLNRMWDEVEEWAVSGFGFAVGVVVFFSIVGGSLYAFYYLSQDAAERSYRDTWKVAKICQYDSIYRTPDGKYVTAYGLPVYDIETVCK